MRQRPPGSAPTVRDVGIAAGVSTMTASRALNGDTRVEATLRDRVLAAAASLNYVVNPAARALRASSDTIAFLADDARAEPVTEMAWGIEAEAREAGVLATTSSAGGDPRHQVDALEVLLSLRPRAVILTGGWLGDDETRTRATRLWEAYRASGGRVVIVGRPLGHVPSVGFDDHALGVQLGRHMGASGRRSALILAGRPDHHAYQDRVRGFERGLREHDVDDIRVRYGAIDRDAAREVTERALHERPAELILCGNDRLAIGALRAAAARGLAVPDDVLVSGVDDMPQSQDLTPPLTSVRLPFVQAGRLAVRIALADVPTTESVLLHGDVVERESTRWRRPA